MMVSIKGPVCLCVLVALAGCVAPEAPPAPRINPSAAARPALSTAGYEDAPLPNRKLGAASTESVIRVAR
jgi:hypothetical protein